MSRSAPSTKPSSRNASQTPSPASSPLPEPAHVFTGDSTVLQVIDDSGAFIASESALSALVASTVPSAQSTAYSLVGIMGCQSTGKSTLLNLLFGTQFREMDAVKGRSQTTRGVWLDSGSAALRAHYAASSPSSQSLIIMDLEGTDSGERGEDRTTFERQTSLLALSLSEVLIVNMWEHDIGRYTASNYGILKTIFEVNLALFAPASRTHLLFLIRDHIEDDTPFHSLTLKLRHEVERIWADINKPAAYSGSKPEALFTFHYYALPHFKLQRDAFMQRVHTLRDMFLLPSHSDYLYGASREGEKGSVPAEGFGVYVKAIWETIRANKELNLPTQKEMLATFRCDEIIGQQTHAVQAAVRERRETERWLSEYRATFGATCSALVHQALSDYDALTQYYHSDIVCKKRNDLLQRLVETLEETFAAQAGFLLDSALSAFATSLSASLLSTLSAPPEKDIPDDFYSLVRKAEEAALAFFDENAHEVTVAGLEALTAESRRNELLRRMEERTARERTKVLSRLDAVVEAKVKAIITAPLALILRRAEPGMWQEVLALYSSTLGSVTAYLARKAAAYRMSDAELREYESRAAATTVAVVRSSVEQHSSLIVLHMRRRFDRLFRYDDDGFIRKWKGSDDVRGRWKQCQAQALTLLDLFSTFRLPRLLRDLQQQQQQQGGEGQEGSSDGQAEDDGADVLIPAPRREQIELEFPEEIEGALREAEAEQERIRESRRIPAWGLALILFLGFDEFMAVLRNPLLLLLLVVVGGGLYVLWSSGMLGPAQTVALAALRQAVLWLEGTGVSVGMLRQLVGMDAGERARGRRIDGVELASTDAHSNGVSSAAGDSDIVPEQRSASKHSGGGARSRVAARHAKAMTISQSTAVASELKRKAAS